VRACEWLQERNKGPSRPCIDTGAHRQDFAAAMREHEAVNRRAVPNTLSLLAGCEKRWEAREKREAESESPLLAGCT
jgi:hypothetical protein